MKVKELIEKLSKYPEDTLVVVSGYENGYDDILNIIESKVSIDENHEEWEGKYTNVFSRESGIVLNKPNIDCLFLESREYYKV